MSSSRYTTWERMGHAEEGTWPFWPCSGSQSQHASCAKVLEFKSCNGHLKVKSVVDPGGDRACPGHLDNYFTRSECTKHALDHAAVLTQGQGQG